MELDNISARIDEFLVSNEWTCSSTECSRVYTKTQTVLKGYINGHPITQDRTIVIEYLGSGEFTNCGEEVGPIYGYRIDGDDIWVHNLTDFEWWYNHSIYDAQKA